MPLVELTDGSVQHAGDGACGRIWFAADEQSAMERAMHCPDLNDELLSLVVNQQVTNTAGLMALAETVQTQLALSLADRANLNASVAALAQQAAALAATQDALTQQVVAVAAQKTTIKYKAVQAPAVVALFGGSVDVTVTWDTPFPDTNYTVYPPSAVTQGISLLGKVAHPVVKSRAADKIVVTVTTTAAVTAGAVEVHALAYRVGA